MVKVTLVHSVFLSLKNGANTVMRSLLESKEQFATNGIEIKSLTPDNFSSRTFDNKGTASLKDDVRKNIKSFLSRLAQSYGWAAAAMVYLGEKRSAKKMALRYIDSNPSEDETAFFHTLYTCYYYLKYRKKKQHTVMVLHTNGETFKMFCVYYKALQGSCFYKRMLKDEEFTIEHADRINFVSKASRENFLKLYPNVNSDKVFYIHNGVTDTPMVNHHSLHKPIEVCCVASISNRKGQGFIVDALKRFDRNNIPDIHFTLVGDGFARETLQKDVEENHLGKYITFIGVTTDVKKYLKLSDIYILPSLDEGLPMAIIEAMRESLPIVSTPVGGIPEMVVPGVTGLLIEPSTKGVYDFINDVNNYDWIAMGKNSRAFFESHFTLKKMVDEYSKILVFEK